MRMSGICKSFPGVTALKRVDFELNQGEVHALVGENGAGKSTLMKILAGVYRADEGEIWLKNQRVAPKNPKTMIDAGVSVIYQELMLIPYLSVAENIFLGREPLRSNGLIDWRTMWLEVEKLLAPFNLLLNPRSMVHSIGPAYQQVVEIAKALSLKADIIVMDEPTAPLTGSEVARLFEIIRSLKAGGVAIAYISHRLEEIHEVADRVTVLRDGERIVTAALSDLTVDEIVRHMVGRRLTEQFPKVEFPAGDELIRVEGLAKKGICKDVSFSVRSGEILGFAGLVGAGRTEIMQLIYGYLRKDAGRIFLRGREVQLRNTRDAVQCGIALIPEERKKQGLVLGLSVIDNSELSIFDLNSSFGFIKWPAIAQIVGEMVRGLDIRTPSLYQQVKNLSGGNQQKIVLSRWFARNCDVFIFDEPTRGIDVGAKAEIYKLLISRARNGAAILLVSSDLPEVMNMSTRILVVFGGQIVKEFRRGEATEEQVISCALGLERPSTEEALVAGVHK